MSFNKRSDKPGYRSDCKACQNEKQAKAYCNKLEENRNKRKIYRAELRKHNQQKLWKYFETHTCVRCGEANPVLLDLDHLRDKKNNISQIIYSNLWETIMEEIEKCQVLCVSCHRKKTAIERGWYKYIPDVEKYLK